MIFCGKDLWQNVWCRMKMITKAKETIQRRTVCNMTHMHKVLFAWEQIGSGCVPFMKQTSILHQRPAVLLVLTLMCDFYSQTEMAQVISKHLMSSNCIHHRDGDSGSCFKCARQAYEGYQNRSDSTHKCSKREVHSRHFAM